MSKYKLHTPEGVQDILKKECYVKHRLENDILDLFRSYGYHEIQSPTFEYIDVFEDESGLIQQETMFKFFDRNGRILTLRPDITTPIARIVSTKFQPEELPLRLCYVGNAFRYSEPYQGAKLREFTQAGIELIGIDKPDADAEVIAMTINSLLASGLKDFQIELGHADFVNGIFDDLGLEEEESEQIKGLIDNKNSIGVQEILEDYNIDSKISELIRSLSNLFGDIKVIDELDSSALNEKSKKALENIKNVYSILEDYELQKYVSIDLGMVQSINYYTGIIFKGFTHGIGFPICSGGRYDGLISKFGKNYSAMGVAIGINRLLSAIERNKVNLNYWKVDSLVAFRQDGRRLAVKIADELRKQGLNIELYLDKYDMEKVKKYTIDKKIGGVIIVEDEDNITILNMEDNTETKTTYQQLLKGN